MSLRKNISQRQRATRANKRPHVERGRRRGNLPTPQAHTLQAGTKKITAYDTGLTNEEKGEIKTIFSFPK